ncbi:hypothetical protein [Cellulomonas sp. KH9]|uniref:hypothetical protein n=1 Tax=Cellulomonas sp. KH9 TaxID=1855324 RepID=UPI0008DF60C4|nr:hypothetical protein [Cellulomonas sp. KH9]SFK55259.1 hypothetical protein SAMN05216467_3762 [Cellulomonas sp. KH9]
MSRRPADRSPDDAAAPPRAPRQDQGARPALLAVACVLVLVEVIALLVAAGAGVLALTRGDDAGPVLFLVALALGAAALLAAAARGLWSGLRWGRGPVLTAQIMVVITAATWWGAGGGVRALVPLVVALAVVVGVLSPRVVAVTSGRRPTG